MRTLLVSFTAVGVLIAFSATAQPVQQGPDVSPAVHHDVSPPLRDIPVSPSARNLTERPLRPIPGERSLAPVADGALQTTSLAAPLASGPSAFAGVGEGDYGFSDQYAPPDTNGAVGATQYVQWVNVDFAVFDKTTHALLLAPTAGNTLWKGFGGGCEANNDGDPIVQYDKFASRWIFTQFSVSTTPYLQCVAVSTTSDATGSYNRYAFDYGTTDFPDYPKLGVWTDAYYITYNIFANGATFSGPKVCAFDRGSMLTGAAATQQCFQLGTSVHSLLPSDLDGTTLPPAGAPNVLARITTSSSLQLWQFHVDWTTPANTTLTALPDLPVAAYTRACNGGTCVPQPGTRQQLDSLADRAMYRFAYRRFADHESWLLNHSVATAISRRKPVGSGIRWYELRRASASSLAVFQQGTFAPDSAYRWMGSIAQDKAGNIAVGYSVSSGTTRPAIRFASRAASDPAGQLGDEVSIVEGAGSQLRSLSRWGDYSAMTIDPLDDCTFWYTNEYLKADGTFNWSTKIASFTLVGCE